MGLLGEVRRLSLAAKRLALASRPNVANLRAVAPEKADVSEVGNVKQLSDHSLLR